MKHAMLLTTAGFINAVVATILAAEPPRPAGLVESEFVFEKSPFRECHASTIADTNSGLVAA